MAEVSEESVEHEALNKAASSLSSTAENTSKVKKNTETIIEVVAIQNRFVISKPEDKELFNLHKHALVHQGNLKEQDGRKARKCVVFLFNDQIVVAKEKGTSLYRRYLFLLSQCTIEKPSTASKNNKFYFQINFTNAKQEKHKLVLICATAEERDGWVRRITNQQKSLLMSKSCTIPLLQ